MGRGLSGQVDRIGAVRPTCRACRTMPWLTAIRTEAKSVTRERRYEDAMRQYGALTQGVRMDP